MFNILGSFLCCKRSRKKQEVPNPTKKVKHLTDCPICHETIVSATVTECGHSYCEYCLLNHLLYRSVLFI